MGRYSAITNNREKLQRIAALLLSIAGKAERASRRSLPVLLFFFWAFRLAEALARDLVMDTAEDLGFRADLPTREFLMLGPRTEALRIAINLRILAAMLVELAGHVALGGSTFREDALAELLRRLERGLSGQSAEHRAPSLAYNDSS